ncbi:MAG: polysaccharide deacetylase family protein [Magnetococcales bacterium]|nr:polysaccharide deacetylase family protein [Magnetococcales bacterium]
MNPASAPTADPLAPLFPGRAPPPPDPAEAPPRLLVVVDTEEAFDWSAPFDRTSHTVDHLQEAPRFQELCESFGLLPCWAVTYPVAHDEAAAEILRPFFRDQRAELGAHLHPWVTPPFDETLSSFHSYPGNLPRELEKAKLRRLTQRLAAAFGRQPIAYRAGRYGLGPHTGAILGELGYRVDLSAGPPFDMTADGGPDYTRLPCLPFRFGQGVLEIPSTGGWTGPLRPWGADLYPMGDQPWAKALHWRGAMSRFGLLNRIRLSPEGFTFPDMRRLALALRRDGVRIFVLSFHSPSLQPGHTPYVRTPEDRDQLLMRCRDFFAFFRDHLGGVWSSPGEMVRRTSTPSPGSAP